MATDYKQYNYNAYYPSDSGYSFAGNACGPTACADVLDVSPLNTAKWMEQHGYATYGDGTVWDGIQACLSAFGGGGKRVNPGMMNGIYSSSYYTQWQQHIQSGYCGVLLMHRVTSNYWTNGGHYIAIVGYKDGQYLVYDPASASRTGYHPWSDFVGNICILYTSTVRWGSGSNSGSTYTFKPAQVYLGSQNMSVLLMQEILCAKGLYKRKLGLDGIFGQGTYKAVIDFQTANKSSLAVDGVCGPYTWTKLLGMDATKNITLEQIKIGSQGEEVLLLQEILMANGYYAGALDKSFGPATQAGLRQMQKDKKITVDGVCGPQTWSTFINIK